MPDSIKDHIFISYASEDADFATWLSRKLIGFGYAVWYDRLKELGGEPYPTDIDEAIKNKTFRFLAIVSKKSNSKSNPIKERTLAINLTKECGIKDFVIPLNLDGIPATEINWMINDLTFIPFSSGWAIGLDQLLKKLESIETPKPITGGRELVASGFLNTECLNNKTEKLYVNYIPFLNVPKSIKVFKADLALDKKAEKSWAFFKVRRSDENLVFSFCNPPSDLVTEYYITFVKDEDAGLAFIHGILTKNVISNLLLKSINLACYKQNLATVENDGQDTIYFPKGLLQTDKLKFTTYDGEKSWVKSCGERKRRIAGAITKYRFHLSPRFKINKEEDSNYFASLRVGLFITDLEGAALSSKQSNARRKSICKDWWNYQWLNRHLAILSFLANGSENIVIGEGEENQVVLSTKFMEVKAPFGIEEIKLNKSALLVNSDVET